MRHGGGIRYVYMPDDRDGYFQSVNHNLFKVVYS